MPVFQRLVNFSEMFAHLEEPPIIINDLQNTTEEEKEFIKEMVTTRYTSDMINMLPRCSCGKTKGEFSIGIKCMYCMTIVKSSIEHDIEPNLWFRNPNTVSKLINPAVFNLLRMRFRRSGFDVIQWLTDVSFRSHVKQPDIITRISESGIQRGYNYFVDNFEQIITYLFSLRAYKLKKNKTDYLKLLLIRDKVCIFTNYLPLPNKAIMVIDKTHLGVFVDPNIVRAVDAIETMVSVDKNFHDQNPKVKENRTAKVIIKLADFYEDYCKTNITPKSGQIRRHIVGSRTNFSFRAVISSITGTHNYDEIFVPWGIGITVFRPHLINKLTTLGMDINAAIGLLMAHVYNYSPLLDKLLNELINESPDKALYVIIQRNPSQLQGSAQRVKITKFKTDPFDNTISMSVLIVRGMNADFDGDAVNCSVSLDQKTSDSWYPLSPKFNINRLDDVLKVSDTVAITKPCVSSHASWLAG